MLRRKKEAWATVIFRFGESVFLDLNKTLKEVGGESGVWGRSIPGRENGKCKGPGMGIALACLRSNTETNVAGTD
jgi:hypothetical protein